MLCDSCACATQVKSLLEGGTFLQREMLTSVLDHLSQFSKRTGIAKYNK